MSDDWGTGDAAHDLWAEHDALVARIDRADRIILQLTMAHNSDPDYVRGFEMAQDYFAEFADSDHERNDQSGPRRNPTAQSPTAAVSGS